jgi:LPXTG-site transpeptidase (sortase) family protein
MLSKRTLFIIFLAGCVFCLLIILFLFFNLFNHFNVKSVSHVDSQAPQKLNGEKQITLSAQASSGLPALLRIPKISIDAKIDFVGVTSDGAVGVPKGPTDVAWFDLGPRPGDNGSAVIDGHYGQWKNGGGSVFDDLNKLIPGDKIYVEDTEGMTVTFVVRELHTYGQNEYAPGVFSSGDGKAHLNLITCEGAWIEAQKTYSNRLIVFTDKE